MHDNITVKYLFVRFVFLENDENRKRIIIQLILIESLLITDLSNYIIYESLS